MDLLHMADNVILSPGTTLAVKQRRPGALFLSNPIGTSSRLTGSL